MKIILQNDWPKIKLYFAEIKGLGDPLPTVVELCYCISQNNAPRSGSVFLINYDFGSARCEYKLAEIAFDN